jgi:hypothetical protein
MSTTIVIEGESMISIRLAKIRPGRWIPRFATVLASALFVAASASSDTASISETSDAPSGRSNAARASEPVDDAALVDGAALDTDADGLPDFQDNCVTVANTAEPMLQGDADRDGFGNACDGDFDQNGLIDLRDFSIFLSCLQGRAGPEDDPACKESDMDGDGAVSEVDFDYFSAGLKNARPGPSGLACAEGALPPTLPAPTPDMPSEESRTAVPCIPTRISDAPLR